MRCPDERSELMTNSTVRDDPNSHRGQKVDALVAPYVERPENVGLAVGIITRAGQHVFCYGVRDRESTAPIDEHTLFEIGSITKVMTANLLAEIERQGMVSSSDPCTKYLPVEANSSKLQAVTLRHLATHTSGLPRLPHNLEDTIQDETNPYAHYGERDLLACLKQVRLRSLGRPRYSNLGMGLLGYLLGRAAGTGYGQALRRFILEPLGLHDTAVELSDEQRSRMAQPHDTSGQPTPPWDAPVLAGAGAVRSSITNLLAFMKANLNAAKANGGTGVVASVRACQQPQMVRKEESFFVAYIASVALPALSLLVQWAVPIRPGRLAFAVVSLAPIIIAAGLGRMAHWFVATALVLAGTYWLWGDSFGWFRGLVLAVIVAGLAHTWRWSPMSRPPRLGWQAMKSGGHDVLWHNGGTGGSASFCAIDPERQTSVVVLSNSAQSVDDLAIEILSAID